MKTIFGAGGASFWRRCGLLARLGVRFAAIMFPPTCQSTAGGTFYPKNVTWRVLRARCDMPERLFDGNNDPAVGGEGEGAGVVDLTHQVVGAGFVGEGDLDFGVLGLVDGGIDRLAGEFLEPPGES